MLRLINKFYRHERGATAVEYAMLVVFIALAIVVGTTAFSGGVNTLFENMGTTISGIQVPNP